ncbi:MAG: shikimate dehydrogenase, partial [Lachnospiraceae bacterium]|nr:shikimate dehydrogenase [Lachnospiraceae bacterium]
MEIDGKTKVCALLGDPVEHTLSPLLHNSFGETENVNGVYTAFNVKKDGLEAALKGAFALGIKGFNVTVPHKEDIIPFLSDIDPLAERIGAVNTLALTEKGYKGYNTDVLGFMRTALDFEDEIKDREVIMIGAGGAANAVLCGLYEMGAKKTY